MTEAGIKRWRTKEMKIDVLIILTCRDESTLSFSIKFTTILTKNLTNESESNPNIAGKLKFYVHGFLVHIPNAIEIIFMSKTQ